ncbi:MAG: protein kinase domain-containing protein [Bryobacteraceae bacterium]
MTPQPAADRWKRLEALFNEALERTATARAAFLEHACAGDEALRLELEDLLRHTDATLSDFRQPLHDAMRQVSAEGRRIGPFRLVRLLSEGGMGAVYLAERADNEYTQQVAIKLMRTGLGHDPAMFRRFRTERQILADLNHPYIARLLDGGTTPEGWPYLVMEFIDGSPIDLYCAAHQLTIDGRLQLFLKVCAAVEYAHLNRVIHRDLKPANILVSANGTPKLLDFGIAKLWEPESAESGSPTHQTGRFMTPAYASPEQMRGEPLTQATDIYSLGTVLYQLITGNRPVARGPSTPIELDRLISDPQPPVALAGQPMPPGLDRIVETALRHNPTERYRSVVEFSDALRAYLNARDPSRPHALSLSRARIALVALLLMLSCGVAVLYFLRRNPPAADFNSMKMTRLTTRGDVAGAAVSADGRFVAYTVNGETQGGIWLAQPAANSELRMLGPEPAPYRSLRFSSDGDFLYYLRPDADSPATLYRLPILGGGARPVYPGAGNEVALAPDGKQFASLRIDPVRGQATVTVAALDGTAARTVAVRRRPAYFAPHGIAWSPDSRSIACFGGDASFYTPEAFRIVTIDAASGRQRVLTSKAWESYGAISWPADGRGLIVSASDEYEDGYQIWRVDDPSGETRRVTNDLGNYLSVACTRDARTIVAVDAQKPTRIWVASLSDPDRAAPASPPDIRGAGNVAWSAQGDILYTASHGGARTIWRAGLDGASARELTSSPGFKDEVAATPDGRYVLYSSGGKIWRVDADGSHPRQLTHGALDVHPSASPDSRSVVYGSFPVWSPAIGGKPEVWRVSIDGEAAAPLVDHASSMPQVSPDGNSLAYLRDNPGTPPDGIAIGPFAGGQPQRVFDIPLQVVQWAPDGRSLIFQKSAHGVGNLWRQPVAGGAPTQLTHFTTDEIFSFAVRRDGRLAILRGHSLNDVVSIRDAH